MSYNLPCGPLKLSTSDMLLPGYAVWTLAGRPVWIGQIGQPVEDLAYDGMTIHPMDYEAVKAAAAPPGTPDGILPPDPPGPTH